MLGVIDAGQFHNDAIFALLLHHGLGNAQTIDALSTMVLAALMAAGVDSLTFRQTASSSTCAAAQVQPQPIG
ncbi:MAG: hypothetical protein R2911_43385 [Caldilineaceae bacterium]